MVKTVPVSSLGKIENMMDNIEGTEKRTLVEIKNEIRALSSKIDKSTQLNIDLQAKIVDLMLKITDVMSLVEKAISEKKVSDIQEVTEHNRELNDTLKKVEKELKKDELKTALRRVLEGV